VAQILDFEAAIRELSYSFLNPCAAHLVDSIDEWPGVTSWAQLFDPSPIEAFAVYPSHVDALPDRPFHRSDIRTYLDELHGQRLRPLTLSLNPFGFKECFASSRHLTDKQVRERIVSAVRTGEKVYRQERAQLKRHPVGAKALAAQNPYKPFKPQNRGRRVFCISTDSELRRQFIEAYEEFCKLCKEAWQNHKRGLPAEYPPGAFIPWQPPRANLIPIPL
jgi:hypothetical protein